ncbi:hypothetical protein GCM10011391_03770 [Pullulanibacillus camelliae]|uniref:ATP synthase subunit I n=1 Tax=Pullulanibacillus camelliae TaxID=1707096 RepID=A0A8J2VE78_9BACL|nr:ATP synthase subunit I [Pullulanibacillus camelliae]GGE28452.1 hypothetical protein GCM10011391_03770 [Pullulanibacillus camelliae]
MENEWADLKWMRRLIIILSSGFLTILILLWLLTPAKSFIAGLLLGGLISFYNLLYLARRIRMAGLVAITGRPGLRGTGMFNRILMVAFAVILAVRFPEAIDYRSLILGLLLNFVLLIIVAVLFARKEAAMKEGRDGLGNNSKD